jgi:hypothetical protein
MRYFFDTEFYENGTTIELISIGIVAEDGREFYAESCDFQKGRIPPGHWIWDNVWPHLHNKHGGLAGQGDFLHREQIRLAILQFVEEGGAKPEWWAYYADYDWVVLCQLFGPMIDLPDGWPMFCLDIKQEAVRLGNPALPEQVGTEHHALADARWNREAWQFLRGLDPDPNPDVDGLAKEP